MKNLTNLVERLQIKDENPEKLRIFGLVYSTYLKRRLYVRLELDFDQLLIIGLNNSSNFFQLWIQKLI